MLNCCTVKEIHCAQVNIYINLIYYSALHILCLVTVHVFVFSIGYGAINSITYLLYRILFHFYLIITR